MPWGCLITCMDKAYLVEMKNLPFEESNKNKLYKKNAFE